MAKSISKRTLVGFRNAKANTRYFEDIVHQIKDRPEKFITKIKKGQTFWKTNNNDNALVLSNCLGLAIEKLLITNKKFKTIK